MQTGDLVISTGLFQAQCACRTALELRRGQECPPCPACGADVVWTFQRGANRQTPASKTSEPPTDVRRRQAP